MCHKKYTEEIPDGCLREQTIGFQDCDFNKEEKEKVCIQNQ
jgi:hypothetical protein